MALTDFLNRWRNGPDPGARRTSAPVPQEQSAQNPEQIYDCSKIVDEVFARQSALDKTVYSLLDEMEADPRICDDFNFSEERTLWAELSLENSDVFSGADFVLSEDAETFDYFTTTYGGRIKEVLSSLDFIQSLQSELDEFSLFKTSIYNVFNNKNHLPFDDYFEQVVTRAEKYGMSVFTVGDSKDELLVEFDPLMKINRGSPFYSYEMHLSFNLVHKKTDYMYRVDFLSAYSRDKVSGDFYADFKIFGAFDRFNENVNEYCLEHRNDSIFFKEARKEVDGVPYYGYRQVDFLDPSQLTDHSDKSYRLGETGIYLPKSQVILSGDKLYAKTWYHEKLSGIYAKHLESQQRQADAVPAPSPEEREAQEPSPVRALRYGAQQARAAAQNLLENNALILDTETTGLGPDDEIVELAILDCNGTVHYDSLFKPEKEMHPAATKVSGITNEMLADKPLFKDEFGQIMELLNGHPIIAFNEAFDERMFLQTAARYGQDTSRVEDAFANRCCAQKIYDQYIAYDRSKLEYACAAEGIDMIQDHRAAGDCRMTAELLKRIADPEHFPHPELYKQIRAKAKGKTAEPQQPVVEIPVTVKQEQTAKDDKKPVYYKNNGISASDEYLELFRQKKTFEEIAQIRGVAPSTVESAIVALYEKGKIDDIRFMIDTQYEPGILAAISDPSWDGKLKTIKEQLPESCSYGCIRAVIACHKKGESPQQVSAHPSLSSLIDNAAARAQHSSGKTKETAPER